MIIFFPCIRPFKSISGVSLPHLVHTHCPKKHHIIPFCHATWTLRGSTGRSNLSYPIYSAIDSIWVAGRSLAFNLHHNFASRIFFPAKTPLLRCHQRCLLSHRNHRARGRWQTEHSPCCADMPVGIDHGLGEAKLTVSCWATSLWIIFISAAWLLSFLSLSSQIDAVIWSHGRNLYHGRYNIP